MAPAQAVVQLALVVAQVPGLVQQAQVRQALVPVRQALRLVVLQWRALVPARLRRLLLLWLLVWLSALRRRHHRPIRPRRTQLPLTLNRLFVWKNVKRRKQTVRCGLLFRLFL
ncbi:MAG: hypothetical protein PHD57_09850 [Desulfobacterales bacterium]|nr:hypothetical protein [Desulfobacterales bacterium]